MQEQQPSYSLTSYFGGKDTDAYRSYKEGQKSGQYRDLPDYIAKTGGNAASGGSNLNSSVANAQQLAQRAVQPAVGALEATKAPLQQRYKDLLDSIKGQQQTATNRQTVATSNELAKRGILGESGLAQQEMVNALNPITSEYTSLIKDTGNQQEIDLAGIASQIAGLQSNAGLQGLTLGNQQYQFGQTQNLQQQQLDAQRQQNQLANQLAQMTYKDITLPESRASIANINSQIADRGSSAGMTAEDFLRLFNPAAAIQSSAGGGVNINGKNYTTFSPTG